MHGTHNHNATQTQLGQELGFFLSEIFSKEYPATGKSEYTNILADKTKKLLRAHASSNRPIAIREMIRVFSEHKREIMKTAPITTKRVTTSSQIARTTRSRDR